MTESLEGKVAIVSGGSRGIGRAIVTALAGRGASCIFTYREGKEQADSLVAEIRKGMPGTTVIAVQHDVRDFQGAQALAERVKTEQGRLDILVNNAGITKDRSLMMMTKEDWDSVIETNLTGVFNLSRAVIIPFLRQKSGHIVNVASAGGIHPLAGQTNYAASKAGVIAFTKSLAREVAPYNIRVNAVAPGFVSTDMTAGMREKQRNHLESRIPAGRFGTPEDVAGAVLFLLGDGAAFVTGEVIEIDGGFGLLG